VSIFERILRAGEGRMVKRLKAVADAVNAIEQNYTDLTDDELRALTDQYKERSRRRRDLDDLLPEAFATVREAAHRVLGQRPYDVQLMGGASLHWGNISEMKTGEGKTLDQRARLPQRPGRQGRARRHHERLPGPARRRVDGPGPPLPRLTVGVDPAHMRRERARAAYQCDITYGTNNEFGFDYLRDNMAWSHEELVQRGHHFAIVDEVDSILIDEARTPLIISGPAEQSAKWYGEFARVVKRLESGKADKDGGGEIDFDYEVDESKRTVSITERGVARVEDQLGIDNLTSR
jgi:preprotein translocase subunit SecA